METIESIKVADINDKHILQLREKLSDETVREYAEVYQSRPKDMPPIEVFRQLLDDGQHIDTYADGAHRIKAVRLAGLKTIDAKIHYGDRRAAILYAAGCNARHGLKRTYADKRYAVSMLLNDPEWVSRSDRWIAEQCQVSADLVGDMRRATARTPKQLAQLSESTVDEPRRIGRDGRRRKRPKSRAKDMQASYERGKASLASRKQSENVVAIPDKYQTPVCPACKTHVPVEGQDRCAECIAKNRTHPDDDPVAVPDDVVVESVTVSRDQAKGILQILDSIKRLLGEQFTNPKSDLDHLLMLLDRRLRKMFAE